LHLLYWRILSITAPARYIIMHMPMIALIDPAL